MPTDAIELINTMGLPMAALLLVTFAFLTRRIVTRGEFDDIKTQRDRMEGELKATRDDLRRNNELLARAMEHLSGRKATP